MPVKVNPVLYTHFCNVHTCNGKVGFVNHCFPLYCIKIWKSCKIKVSGFHTKLVVIIHDKRNMLWNFEADLLRLNGIFFQKANLKYTVSAISIGNTSPGSTVFPRNWNFWLKYLFPIRYYACKIESSALHSFLWYTNRYQ